MRAAAEGGPSRVPASRSRHVLPSLTLLLVLAPERGLGALRAATAPDAAGDPPLLRAAGVASLPIVAAGLSAAMAAAPSVGAIVTSTLAAALAYLGGAVAAVRSLEARFGDADPLGAHLGSLASAAVSLAALVGSFGPMPLRLFAVGIGAVWAYVCVFRGASALRSLGAFASARTASWAAMISSGPALLRLALP